MIKKIAALAGAGAILLLVVAPVMAIDGFDGPFWSWDEAYVNNSAAAIANTGGNSQGNYASALGCYNTAKGGSGSGDRWMRTGSAFAFSRAVVVANPHLGCDGCSDEPYHWDFARVNNSAYAEANTGANSQNNSASAKGFLNRAGAGSGSGDRGMRTGPASAHAAAWTIVNPHASFFALPEK